MDQQVIIALTKGRILKETLPLLAAAGIEALEDISKSRKLILQPISGYSSVSYPWF